MIQIEKPGVGKRLVSMLLDHFCTCFILAAPMIPLILFTSRSEEDSALPPVFQFVFLGLLVLYFFKDSFDGRSIAKRVTGLQVVDHRTGERASVGKCFVRNLTIPLWPLEVLITLFSSDRRLGDLLAGTSVVHYGAFPVPAFEFEGAINKEMTTSRPQGDGQV